MATTTKTRKALVTILRKHTNSKGHIRRNEILRIAKANGYEGPGWLMNGARFRVESGVVNLKKVTDADLEGEARTISAKEAKAAQAAQAPALKQAATKTRKRKTRSRASEVTTVADAGSVSVSDEYAEWAAAGSLTTYRDAATYEAVTGKDPRTRTKFRPDGSSVLDTPAPMFGE